MQNFVSSRTESKKSYFSTLVLVKISVLAVIAFILMLFDLPLPLFPSFLKIDVSDVPVLIGTLSLGPVAGIFIELIKNLLHLITKNDTAGVGELANFIIGVSYILPLSFIYSKKKNLTGLIIASIIAVVSMTVIASFLNYFFLIPFYATLFHMPIDAFVDMTAKLNGFVKDFKTLVIFAIAPFNIIKGIMLSVLGCLLYKVLRPIL